MALTKINNNTLSAVTTLPAAIATGKVLQKYYQIQKLKLMLMVRLSYRVHLRIVKIMTRITTINIT